MSRMMGSPRAVRDTENERNLGLRQLQFHMQTEDATQKVEASVRERMDRLRDERSLDQAKIMLGMQHAAEHKVKGMDLERLRDFESQQYTAMANLDAEIRDLANKERELRVSERVDDANKRAIAAGVVRADATQLASAADNGELSRKQRQDRLLAERSARQEVIKRQKEHLYAERTNIELDLRNLQSNKFGSVSHADAVDKIQMTRQGGGGQTFKGHDNKPIGVPDNSNTDTHFMVNQLASRYHEDRRKLQLLREQQSQLQKEIETTKFSNWKPSARDEAAEASTESKIESQIQARAEFAREVKFEQSKRELSQIGKPEKQRGVAVSEDDLPSTRSPPLIRQHSLGSNTQKMPLPSSKPASTGNALFDEVQALKYDYMSRGGKDSALFEAISALERQATVSQPARPWGGGMQDFAQMAGANAVQAMYSKQWSGIPGMHGDGLPARNLMGPPADMHQDYGMPLHHNRSMQMMKEELMKLDAAIDERQRDSKRLEHLLEHTPHARKQIEGDSAEAANSSRRDGSGHGSQLTEEEKELIEMEKNPNNTDFYRLRKKHLKEMVSLKYEMQRLQQETAKGELEQQVELMKKEHERREWVLKQQQQLLEAKYRKHMAREKPFTNLGDHSAGSKPKDTADYSPDVGFHMYVDYVLGLPSKVNNQVQIVYGFYEGAIVKTEAKSLPMSGVDNDGAGLRTVLAVKRSFLKVFNNDKFKVLLELQSVIPATVDRGPRTMPVGWTMLRLFEEDGSFKRGLWRVPMFLPPVRPDFAPEDMVNVHRIKDLEVFMRLVPGQQGDVHDRFSINPDMTQMQYKYPKELKLKEPEKRIAAVAPSQPGPVPSLPLPDQSAEQHLPAVTHTLIGSATLAAQAIAPQQSPVALGSAIPSMFGPPVALQVKVHDVSGSIFGHGHCQEPGPVFVRISLVALNTGQIISTTIGAHVNPAVTSPGLRVMEKAEEDREDGEEEEVLKRVQGSWCTSGVVGIDPSLMSWGQGCMLENVPCSTNVGLLFELFREQEGPWEGDPPPPTLRQNPDNNSTFIAWATIPLFAQSRLDETESESDERSEWSKVGLRALTGVQEKALLAPPVTHGNDYDTVRLQQSKYADVLSCDGLATSSGGATVILNSPLPTLRVTIEAPNAKTLEKFGHAAADMLSAEHKLDRKRLETIFKYTDVEAWVAAPDPPVSNELITADDGFDLYIDGARWLPDNVTLSTVTCYVANDKMQLYGKFEKEIDPRTMNIRCPFFLARKEMRKDPSKDWDPTMTLLIQVNGLEGNPADYIKSDKDLRRDAERAGRVREEGAAVKDLDTSQHSSSAPKLQCVIVGFAVLHIFVDPISCAQPADSGVREYVLNEGSFQISIHRSGLKEKEALSVRALDDELRRLCTTLLVRIVKAPRSADGMAKVMSVKDHATADETELEELKLIVRPKPYHEQGYSSSSFSAPSAVESAIYRQRMNAQSVKMMSAAEVVMGMVGQRLEVQDEKAIADCNAFGADHFNETVASLRGHIKKMFRNNPPARVLDPRYNVPYLPDQGFLLAVDGVDNMTQDYFAVWTGALCSTSPHALFYNASGQVGSDLTLSYQMDFQADASSPRWSDGWMWYRQRDASKGRLVAVIDVRMVVTEAKVGRKMKKLKNRQVIQLGFAFLPIIGSAGNYVMSGNYRLPLYAMGAKPKALELDQADQLKAIPWGPSPELLESIEVLDTKIHIQQALEQAVKDHQIHQVPAASVVCRLVDRYGEFTRPFIVEAGPLKVDTSCLPVGQEKQYAPVEAKVSLQKKLKDSVGSFSVHNGLMLDFFKSELVLPPSIHERPAPPADEIILDQSTSGDGVGWQVGAGEFSLIGGGQAGGTSRRGGAPSNTTPQKAIPSSRPPQSTTRIPPPPSTRQAGGGV